MKFEWDQRKAIANIRKHGISFERAALVFSDRESLSIFDEGHSHSEERWVTLGEIPGGDIVVVVHTYRKKGGEEFIRIISARKAAKKELTQYFHNK